MSQADALRRFSHAYASQRAREGRGAGGERELLALPYLRTGPNARQWKVRARSYDRLLERIIQPMAREREGALGILDVGAGNGWLCYRLNQLGHEAVALDLRTDAVDGLGAARGYERSAARMFARVSADFAALPVRASAFDLIVFNAAIHYATDLPGVFRECRNALAPGGRLVIMDSPFYRSAADGAAMVQEKLASARRTFGEDAPALTALPFIEYLTRDRLVDSSRALGIAWRHHHVRYPLWYELRPLAARLRGLRAPSRFDLWEGLLT